jgi:hypothetical protein
LNNPFIFIVKKYIIAEDYLVTKYLRMASERLEEGSELRKAWVKYIAKVNEELI